MLAADIPRLRTALVWFEALRDVEVGEELCFSYGPEYSW